MRKALLLSLSLCVCGAARADDAAILQCRSLPEAAARLACYDAMPVGAPAAAAGFGADTLAKPKAAPKEAAPQAMESTVLGDFEGWGPNSRIKLANGQVWRIVDDSSAVLPRRSNVKVRIERNLFGTMFLKVEGSNDSAKVRRVE